MNAGKKQTRLGRVAAWFGNLALREAVSHLLALCMSHKAVTLGGLAVAATGIVATTTNIVSDGIGAFGAQIHALAQLIPGEIQIATGWVVVGGISLSVFVAQLVWLLAKWCRRYWTSKRPYLAKKLQGLVNRWSDGGLHADVPLNKGAGHPDLFPVHAAIINMLHTVRTQQKEAYVESLEKGLLQIGFSRADIQAAISALVEYGYLTYISNVHVALTSAGKARFLTGHKYRSEIDTFGDDIPF